MVNRDGKRGPLAAAAQVSMLASAVVIAGLVAAINLDIGGRALFDRPLRGVTEVASLAIPVMVFLALPGLVIDDALIRAGVLSRWLARGGRRFAAGLGASFRVVELVLLAAVLAATGPWLLRAWRDDEFIGVAGDFTAPLWPAKLAIVLGGGLAWLATLGALGRAVRTVGPRPAAWLPLLLLALPLCCAVVDGRAAVGAMSIAVLFVLLYAGLPVAFALLAAAALGIGVIKGDAMIAVSALGLAAGGAVSSYVFAAVPLFVLMGLVVGRADIGRDSLEAAEWLLGRVVGGLGIATVAANAVFAAITGISIASASIFGKVAVPPLVEQGYTARYAVGLVAGSSVLGMLIPPSLLLIVYGLIAEVSINRLFVAAVAPGVILTVLFAGMTAFAAWRRLPFAVTAALRPGRSTAFGARGAARRAAPIAGMIAAVLGGIYAGVFTPTEAGAVGALLALGAALLMRRVSARALGALLLEAAAASSSLLFLIVAASAFGMMLTLSGIPTTMGELAAAAGLGLGGYVLLYVLLLIVLGTVLDSTSILLIMVPLALPTVAALGGDLVWFGIVNVIGVEVGLLTPPLGLSVFAIKAALDDQSITLNEIFLGALPFVVAMLLLLGLLIAAPGVSTFLL